MIPGGAGGLNDHPRRVISSVQYLKVPVGDRVPVALGIDLPAIAAQTVLTPEQRRALDADLAPDR